MLLRHLPLQEGHPLVVGGQQNGQASLVAQMVMNLSTMQETWIHSLGLEDPLEEGIATNSSILAWRILMDVGALWATVHGVAKGWT